MNVFVGKIYEPRSRKNATTFGISPCKRILSSRNFAHAWIRLYVRTSAHFWLCSIFFVFQVQELSDTRESLVGAETSKKHLEIRVVELTKQLQGNEEKLAVYERRSGGVNGVTQALDQDVSREQQLEAEVAELRSVTSG